MTPQTFVDPDPVNRLIKHCHGSKDNAENLFREIILHKKKTVRLPEGELTLSGEQHEEFVERYSSEVEPSLWESKRRKQ